MKSGVMFDVGKKGDGREGKGRGGKGLGKVRGG